MSEFSIIKDDDEILIRVWSGTGTETHACSIDDFLYEARMELEKFGYVIMKKEENLSGVELAELAATLNRLKKENEQYSKEIQSYQEKNRRLKETLRKCDPHGDGRRCIKCNELFADHAENCEYVELTKENEEEE